MGNSSSQLICAISAMTKYLPESNCLRVEFCTLQGVYSNRGDTVAIMSFVEFNAFVICRELDND